ncbi:hypothetical protein JQ594_21695 [Bradyrhizobium manausense]|uniref:hypothetical protein n=1 Tax=Bradyrhizobium manausense TaxID=989370 RepID=UPI001BAB05E9|nr:hypothetical protein [Bradyrhizobium manausense]MBR0688555.1 hypothetical protein [Bradyrhizobium manausense]
MLAVTIDVIDDRDEAQRHTVAAMRITRTAGPYAICAYEVGAVEDDDGFVTATSCVVEIRGRDDIWSVVENACRAIAAG